MKTQKLIVIGLIAVIAIVGIGIYIYADIQTQHGMTVEKYCEKYDCHIVVTRVIFVKATLDQGKKICFIFRIVPNFSFTSISDLKRWPSNFKVKNDGLKI